MSNPVSLTKMNSNSRLLKILPRVLSVRKLKVKCNSRNKVEVHNILSYITLCLQIMNRNDKKRMFGHVRPTKTNQPAHSDQSPSCRLKKLCIQNAPSEDSDQTARMRRLIWIFAGCTCTKVRFLMLRMKYIYNNHDNPLCIFGVIFKKTYKAVNCKMVEFYLSF